MIPKIRRGRGWGYQPVIFPKSGKFPPLLNSLHASSSSRFRRWRRLSPMELRLPQLPRAARRNVTRESSNANAACHQRRLRALVSARSFSRSPHANRIDSRTSSMRREKRNARFAHRWSRSPQRRHRSRPRTSSAPRTSATSRLRHKVCSPHLDQRQFHVCDAATRSQPSQLDRVRSRRKLHAL